MGDAETVNVKVLFFAKARELSGINQAEFKTIFNPSYEYLLNEIVESFSLEKIRSNILLAVNQEFCKQEESISLKNGDEIAVIPPISGGKRTVNFYPPTMDFIKIVETKLSLEEISELVTKSTCGAVSFFVGTTRDYFEDKKVIQLEYEAYDAMAVKAIKGICDQIRNKWKVENIAIYHRIGIVPVKEASVIIAVSSVHRADSLQAVQYAIDSLKASVPIWKKEVYEIASAEWKENQESSNFYALEEHSYIKTEDKPHPYTIEEQSVPSHLIQIKADADEIKNRIEKFIERKREGINQGNIRDFCPESGKRKKDSSCARVDAVLIQRKDSKSHLRVTRVLNKWGPQTMGLDPGSVGDPNLIKTSTEEKNYTQDISNHVSQFSDNGIEERIADAENYLGISSKSIPKDVYARLKQIEEKILYLESISPEYTIMEQTSDRPLPKEFIKSKKMKVYSINDVEKKIKEVEMQLAAKSQ